MCCAHFHVIMITKEANKCIEWGEDFIYLSYNEIISLQIVGWIFSLFEFNSLDVRDTNKNRDNWLLLVSLSVNLIQMMVENYLYNAKPEGLVTWL